MHTLRGAIFSLRNVLAKEGPADQSKALETVKLIKERLIYRFGCADFGAIGL